jgi:hypothetical protein
MVRPTPRISCGAERRQLQAPVRRGYPFRREERSRLVLHNSSNLVVTQSTERTARPRGRAVLLPKYADEHEAEFLATECPAYRSCADRRAASDRRS